MKKKDKFAPGLSFQCGMQEGPMSIILNFNYQKKPVFHTAWTPDEAEMMAYAILKYVELARIRERAQAEPTPVLPDQPRIH